MLTGRRLGGWARLGIALSVAWTLVVGYLWLATMPTTSRILSAELLDGSVVGTREFVRQEQWKHTIGFLPFWFTPIAVMYAVAGTVRWIYRGFREPDAPPP